MEGTGRERVGKSIVFFELLRYFSLSLATFNLGSFGGPSQQGCGRGALNFQLGVQS
jgi:hypothetical protein